MAVRFISVNHINNACEYRMDVAGDASSLPTPNATGTGAGGTVLASCGYGSKAYCIADNAWYYVSAQGTWTKEGVGAQLAPLVISSGAALVGEDIVITHPHEEPTIYYTIAEDGSTPADPTSSSTKYDPDSPPTITAAKTVVKALASLTGYADSAITKAEITTEQATKPVMPESGAVLVGDEIAISSPGAVIYYTKTTDGSTPDDPTDASTEYTAPIEIGAHAATKIKAIAYRDGYRTSAITAGDYTTAQMETPVITPASGEVLVGSKIEIAGDSVFYNVTVDGTDPADPTEASTAYTGPITVTAVAATKVKAISIKTGYRSSAASAISSYTTAQVATPTADPVAGAVAADTPVALASTTEGATIHYTVDESDPTAASPVYTEPIAIEEATTIKAIAVKSGLRDSAVLTAAYTV